MSTRGGDSASSESAMTVAAGAGRKGLLASMRSILSRNQWMVADQALVSGMNFLTTVLLARMLGVYSFGIFSVFYILLQYLNSIQVALIVSPMMSIAPQLKDAKEYRSFLRGMAGYQYLFSLGCGVVTVLFAFLGGLHLVPWRMESSVVLPFILTIFWFQAQDWFRRFCYVQDRGKTVFWNDVLSYTGQIAAFGILWRLGRMNIPLAYYAIAGTSLAAFAVGFFGDDIRSSWKEIRSSFACSWAAGRSLLVASQSQWLGSQGIFLIVAALAGVSAASGIRAVITLMGPVIMLFQLLDNVIPVRAARAYAEGGELSLVGYLRRAGAILAVLVGTPIFLASVFARPILTLVFGKAYSGFAALVIWAGVYMSMSLVYRGFLYYYRTLNKTAVVARSAIVGSAVAITACLLMTRRFGATGGMIALVAGQLLSVVMVAGDFSFSKWRGAHT